MTLFRPLAALLLFALAACATTAPEPADSGWYVMRHLQKGEGQDPPLSEEGRAKAERLAGWFAEGTPTAIYVSTTRRARETAAPLAARRGLTMQEYDPRDTAALVRRLRAEPGSVLVVGHSNTVPEIVAQLGGAPRPSDIREDRYGDIFRVGRDGSVELMGIDVLYDR